MSVMLLLVVIIIGALNVSVAIYGVRIPPRAIMMPALGFFVSIIFLAWVLA
ncbi:hypothetical protein SAMN05880590_102775 [Rhizobium sp. RU35A]|uniref:hypothetical protein n=1 Tax=Rhizobium sp. RU35A TaxID=1907414 RepID=UPI000953E915|nr:hypothetical protein [Rhizobium sp. RU35A]SIQ24624.1 hypothetical protein SAMN05880590_102775 [Rhizobium sp. RU35A]